MHRVRKNQVKLIYGILLIPGRRNQVSLGENKGRDSITSLSRLNTASSILKWRKGIQGIPKISPRPSADHHCLDSCINKPTSGACLCLSYPPSPPHRWMEVAVHSLHAAHHYPSLTAQRRTTGPSLQAVHNILTLL